MKKAIASLLIVALLLTTIVSAAPMTGKREIKQMKLETEEIETLKERIKELESSSRGSNSDPESPSSMAG